MSYDRLREKWGQVRGNILVGMVSGINGFRMDGTGQVFAHGGYQTGGADFAESIEVSGERTLYQPGDLLNAWGGRRKGA